MIEIEVIMISFNKHEDIEIKWPLKSREAYESSIGLLLSEYKNMFLVHTCTAALEITGLALDLSSGDEVILPSYTFVSTANAYALRGAKLVFADVDENMNLDVENLEMLITPRTKAVVAVHYGGTSCDIDKLQSICEKHGLILIEDAAQGIRGTFKGKPLGTFGDFSCFSFHESKNIHCYEGGLLVVNNAAYLDAVHRIIHEGTDKHDFFSNRVRRYTWKSLGSSYMMDVLRMAYLEGQLMHADKITSRRKEIVNSYQNRITRDGFKGVEHNGHLYYVIVDDQDKFISYMNEKGIQCLSHYEPLHLSEAGQKYGWHLDLSGTERAFNLVRLPVHELLTDEDVEYIIECVESYNG